MGLAGHMAALLGFQPALAQPTLKPSGSGISGWPYGNLTGFSTSSGSSCAEVTSTDGSDDSFDISFSIFTPTSSVGPPPNSTTQHFYPAISPIVLYSTVTILEFLDIKGLTHAMPYKTMYYSS